MDTKINLPFS